MPSAKDIVAERFAKGEITKDEYESILSALDTTKSESSSVNLEDKTNLEKIAGVLTSAGLALGGLLIFIIFNADYSLNSLGELMVILSIGLIALGLYMKFGLDHSEK